MGRGTVSGERERTLMFTYANIGFPKGFGP